MDDLFEEFQNEQEDDEVMTELKERKRDKSFSTVINKKRLNRFELEEALA